MHDLLLVLLLLAFSSRSSIKRFVWRPSRFPWPILWRSCSTHINTFQLSKLSRSLRPHRHGVSLVRNSQHLRPTKHFLGDSKVKVRAWGKGGMDPPDRRLFLSMTSVLITSSTRSPFDMYTIRKPKGRPVRPKGFPVLSGLGDMGRNSPHGCPTS